MFELSRIDRILLNKELNLYRVTLLDNSTARATRKYPLSAISGLLCGTYASRGKNPFCTLAV